MGYYNSEREAAYFALRELEGKLPKKANNTDREWGTVIFRFKDKDGVPWYTYQPIYTGDKDDQRWDARGRPFDGAEEIAVCHSHPNNSPFSPTDIDLALGSKWPFPRCRVYMVNQSGAYSYNGRLCTSPTPAEIDDRKAREAALDEELRARFNGKVIGTPYPRDSWLRFVTLWGLDFDEMYFNFYPDKRKK